MQPYSAAMNESLASQQKAKLIHGHRLLVPIAVLSAALTFGTANLLTPAGAATSTTAGGICKSEGSKTTIGLKKFVCTNTSKTKAKKLVWIAAATPSLGAPSGSAVGKTGGEPGHDGFGPDGEHGPRAIDPTIQKAFSAYSACLVKNGGVAQNFGPRPGNGAGGKVGGAPKGPTGTAPGPNPGMTPGTNPGPNPGMVPGTNPGPRPSASAAQLKAEAACASLRPQFGGMNGFGGDDQHGAPDGSMGGSAAPLVAPTKSSGA